jgi:beta-glucosidase
VTAEEYRSVGLHMILGPQIDVTTEPRWGRNAGCFSESAELTAEMIGAFILGCQGETIGPESALCMIKHWPGSGPHLGGKGQQLVYPGDNFDYHLIPWRAAFAVGAAAVMPYYSGTPFDDGLAVSYSNFIIQETLRERLGFDGVACTDWGVIGRTGPLREDLVDLPVKERYAMSINAGVDQFGAETDPTPIIELVNEGTISEERIDVSVGRILKQAFQLGLFENPYVDTNAAATIVKSPENQALGYKAQLKSIVLLTNDGTLPFPEAVLDVAPNKISARNTQVYVSGIDPTIAGHYATVVEDLKDADFAILRVDATAGGFRPGSEEEEVGILFPEETMASVEAVADTGVPTVVALNLGSTLVVLPQELLDSAVATLMLFDVLDNALLDVVFGRFNPVGKLPFDLPSSMDAVRNQLEDVPFDTEDPLFKFGHGLSYEGTW